MIQIFWHIRCTGRGPPDVHHWTNQSFLVMRTLCITSTHFCLNWSVHTPSCVHACSPLVRCVLVHHQHTFCLNRSVYALHFCPWAVTLCSNSTYFCSLDSYSHCDAHMFVHGGCVAYASVHYCWWVMGRSCCCSGSMGRAGAIRRCVLRVWEESGALAGIVSCIWEKPELYNLHFQNVQMWKSVGQRQTDNRICDSLWERQLC